jgi:amidase
MAEPCDLSAVEARRLIGRKRLSPIELLESCIARIEMVNGSVNAVVAKCYDRARQEAQASTEALVRGDALGPLHGLPLGVKDLNDTEGLVTTYGSPLYRDHVPAQDERLVAALRKAGAIVVGKTNTPEFGAGANTFNEVFGATRNPWNTRLSAAGSSGGAAVSLATGMAWVAHGSARAVPAIPLPAGGSSP